jgi:hypothetical protein
LVLSSEAECIFFSTALSEGLEIVSENSAASVISLYPNPAMGEQVNVISSEGVLSAEAVSNAGAVISLEVSGGTIDVKSPEAGIYGLSIKTESGVKIVKFVKE